MATKCLECKMVTWLCLCGRLPRVWSPVRVVILRHASERSKASNTGRVLAKMLENSRLVTLERREPPDVLSVLRAEPGAELLFPSRTASALGRAPAANGVASTPRTLVVLDGSWAQTKRMIRKVPGVCSLPRVTLPPGPAGRWDVRDAPRDDHYCTLESIIRAFETLGETLAARILSLGMERARTRLLIARGLLKPGELCP